MVCSCGTACLGVVKIYQLKGFQVETERDSACNQSTTFTLLVVFLSKFERNETQLYQTILSSKLVLYRVQIDKRANNLYMATIDPDLDGQYFGL